MNLRRPALIIAAFVSFFLSPVVPAQEAAGPSLPTILSYSQPIYPQIARTAHVEGDVVATIVTDGERAGMVTIESGSPLLAVSTEQDIRTWRFATHTPGTFKVTFRYKLSLDNTIVIFQPEHNFVEIIAGASFISIYNARFSLGRWQTDFGATTNSSPLVLELETSSGFCGSYLVGSLVHSNGNRDEITDSSTDEHEWLDFTISVAGAGGKKLKTAFVGKIIGKRIVGTYVADDGTRGNWNATRLPEERHPSVD